jgi:hypothetical protein
MATINLNTARPAVSCDLTKYTVPNFFNANAAGALDHPKRGKAQRLWYLIS